MTEQNTQFEGWGICEMMGHQKEMGFIKTEYFGGAALFRVDVPSLEEREITLKAPEWMADELLPAGSVVKREAVEGRTRYISPNAIYALNPCSEETVRALLERSIHRTIKLVTRGAESAKAIPAPDPDDDSLCTCEDGVTDPDCAIHGPF